MTCIMSGTVWTRKQIVINNFFSCEIEKICIRDELCVVVVMLRVDAATPVSQEIVQRRRCVVGQDWYPIVVRPDLHSD